MDVLSIAGTSIYSPFGCSQRLTFPDSDLRAYPWLENECRYYAMDTQIAGGGYSVPVRGFPCDRRGVRISDTEIVLKFPNLDSDGRYAAKKQDERLSYIQQQSIKEWRHVRGRLHECQHANPILDLGTHAIGANDCYVTVQEYIAREAAVPLENWIEDSGLRKDGKRWIAEPGHWIYLASLIAAALADIHRRRVTHGDIRPSKIFIANRPVGDPAGVATFIDFTESFVATPANGLRRVHDNHPYRAPERGAGEYILTEQVDVYSFGKLLLYLATGVEKTIDITPRGHDRRAFIRQEIAANPGLVPQFPAIVDIIARCAVVDPAARPRMAVICEELADLGGPFVARPRNGRGPRGEPPPSPIVSHHRVLKRFIESQATDVEVVIGAFEGDGDMVEINGTRDRIIRALVTLFRQLGPRDSWASITTPSVWQGRALGLDGRYSTATIEALRKGASVQRTFVVSVEELGVSSARQLADKLRRTEKSALIPLAEQLDIAIKEYVAEAPNASSSPKVEASRIQFVRKHLERFRCVVEALKALVTEWGLDSRKDIASEFVSIVETRGLFLGICAVSSLNKVWTSRAANPVSVMYTADEPIEKDRWLLVMTEIHGRNENASSDGGDPLLTGLKIFQSVLGVPVDRIDDLNDIMKTKSVNVGPVIVPLAECLSSLSSYAYDFFISYPSGDKETVARPLYEALRREGLHVWFDEDRLEIGDWPVEEIDAVLGKCRAGLVILSPRSGRARFQKDEVRQMLKREQDTGKKVIFPVSFEIERNKLPRELAELKDRLMGRWEDGLETLIPKIRRALDSLM